MSKYQFCVVYKEELEMMSTWKSPAISVYMGLCLHFSTKEVDGYRIRTCYPSHDTISSCIHKGQSTISRGVKQLKNLMEDGITEFPKNCKKLCGDCKKSCENFKRKTAIKPPAFFTTKKRMGNSSVYEVRYKIKYDLSNGDKTVLSNGDNYVLSNGDKQTNHDNKPIKQTILSDDDISKSSEIIKKYIQEFNWSSSLLEQVVEFYDNKHFLNELIHIGAFMLERRDKGSKLWTSGYWIRGIRYWLESAPSDLSPSRQRYIEKLHSEVLQFDEKPSKKQPPPEDCTDIDNIVFKKPSNWS